MSNLVDHAALIAAICGAVIVIVLLWPMAMDRRQRWRNRRAARKSEAEATRK